jgi:hypothetical protein
LSFFHWIGWLGFQPAYTSFIKISQYSIIFNNLILPSLSRLIIFTFCLCIAGPEIYTEIKDIFIKNLKKFFWKLRPIIRKNFNYIWFCILLITGFNALPVLLFASYKMKFILFKDIIPLWALVLLWNLIPWLGLLILFYLNPKLVKKELINKINFFIIFILITVPVVVPLFFVLYFVDNEFVSDYVNILLYIKSIFLLLILIFILTRFIFMPKNKENYIKYGVTICSIFMIKNFYSTLVDDYKIAQDCKNIYIQSENAKLNHSTRMAMDRNKYLIQKRQETIPRQIPFYEKPAYIYNPFRITQSREPWWSKMLSRHTPLKDIKQGIWYQEKGFLCFNNMIIRAEMSGKIKIWTFY